MSEIAQKTAQMIDILPDEEEALAYELIKRMVLAWDPDFVKVTDAEAERIEAAAREIDRGEFISHDEIDWN